MISAAGRRALDRYALAAREMSAASGDRSARETGSSVEFQDFRSYQPGDELRAVDWRAYARSRRLVTRLYRAERTIDVHVVLDVSPSMGLAGKLDYGRIVAELVSYVGQRDAITRVHTTAGAASPVAQGRVGLARAWGLLEESLPVAGGPGPVEGVRSFALALPKVRGAALAVVISDLFDPQPWRPALVALRARGLDAAFLQVVSEDDLHPPEGRFEVVDVESDERRTVGPEEVRAYRAAVQAFLRRTRSALAQAGFGHVLLRVPAGVDAVAPTAARRSPASGRAARTAAAAPDAERTALAALRRARVLVPR
ncbi:MAG: DUF58 domain-containing protein [Trueperaceae bacterium]